MSYTIVKGRKNVESARQPKSPNEKPRQAGTYRLLIGSARAQVENGARPVVASGVAPDGEVERPDERTNDLRLVVHELALRPVLPEEGAEGEGEIRSKSQVLSPYGRVQAGRGRTKVKSSQ